MKISQVENLLKKNSILNLRKMLMNYGKQQDRKNK